MSHLSETSATPTPVTDGTNISTAVTNIRDFLVFKLGKEEYGINILRVQEIRSFEPPTRMANTPLHVLGVVNLRGVIVPIVDMRIRFKLEPVRYDTFTVVIVLNIGQRVLGMVVDGVSDVVSLTSEQLRPVPDFATGIGSDYLLALGAMAGRLLMLLNIEQLMTRGDMGLASETTD